MHLTKYILISFLIILFGCASSKIKDNTDSEYEVTYTDKNISDRYIVFIVNNQSGDRFILFSDKSENLNNFIPLTDYRQLSVGTKCNIEIHPDTSRYIFHPAGTIRRIQIPYQIYITDLPFLRNDTVVCKVYRSRNVYDMYYGK